MTREDIIKLAREAFIKRGFWPNEIMWECWKDAWIQGAAAEHEKSLRLWMLLDDVDTADDIAKSDDAVYRSLCRQAHQKRWAVLTGDEVDAAIRARGQK